MLLTWLIVLPLLGALPMLLAREQNARELKVWTFVVTLGAFFASLPLWFAFSANMDPKMPGYAFVKSLNWIDLKDAKGSSYLTINFSLGVDGISSLLLLLTTFIMPIAILSSWNYIQKRQKEFYIAMLLLETAMIGVFASTNLFLFYVFFEASLVPMYIIIGVWGGDEKIYATTKFIIYTAFGSLLMFIAILYVYMKTGAQSFEIGHLTERLNSAATVATHLPRHAEYWCFWAFALAFAIKVPLFPVHTWLPDAHVQAPTPGSVVLAAVLLKMGGYGFLRIVFPFFPHAAHTYQPLLMIICVIGIIYGSLMAFVQTDIKKLVAYSSVAHMGTCMLGIFSLTPTGVQGGVYQMLNHGVSTGALFLLIGMLYERTHTRLIAFYGGIAKSIPIFTVAFVIVTLSSIGLPLTNGFIGEFTCLLGGFQQNPWLGLLASTGVILGAVYMLYAVKRMFYGTIRREELKHLADLDGREKWVLAPLIAAVFLMGIYPMPFFNRIAPAAQSFINSVPSPIIGAKETVVNSDVNGKGVAVAGTLDTVLDDSAAK